MKNPYLKVQRLADVLAAITVLGTYKFYKLDVARWADRISGSSDNAEHWRLVFSEHPEFFRFASDSEKLSLVWRRQLPKNFNVETRTEVDVDLDNGGIDDGRISRRPLSPKEITELLGIAINLHDRALEQEKAKSWWIPLAAAVLSFVGAIIGAYLGKVASQ